MKTKLFLFIAVLFASLSITAQINSVAVVGAGVGGWPGEPGNPGPVDVHQLTRTAGTDTWVIENLVVSGPGIKLRANNSWDSASSATAGGNWGRPVSGSQFPTATADEGGGSGDLNTGIIPGTYTLTFDTVTKVYTFSGGAPITVVSIVGAAVPTAGGELMTTIDGINYTLTTALTTGNLQFSVDGVNYGGSTFPNGNAGDSAVSVPVTAGQWVITINAQSADYTFTPYVSPLVNIALVGGATPIGWPDYADPATEDLQKMKNKDDANVEYYLGELPMTAAGCKFRENKAWTNAYAGPGFPTGNADNSVGDIICTTDGTYSVEFNRTTKDYNFFTPKIGLIGEAIGGWDGSNELMLATADGIVYTRSNVVVMTNTQGCKFRLDNRWLKDWGAPASGPSFPSGIAATPTGNNIMATPGTYNVTFNRLTGEFSFADPLATTSFQSLGFSVSPNPTNNAWSFNASKDAIANIQIVDLLGKVVINTTATTVDASALTTGIYFAKVNTTNATATVKVIKN